MADANSKPAPRDQSQGINPFIESGAPQDIECTLCNVSDGLSMLRQTLGNDGEAPLVLEDSELRGMVLTIDGMYSALGEAINRVNELREGSQLSTAAISQSLRA